jgi:hypothetical protein
VQCAAGYNIRWRLRKIAQMGLSLWSIRPGEVLNSVRAELVEALPQAQGERLLLPGA